MHQLFGSLTTDPSRLPPCQDATYKHIMRYNYEAEMARELTCPYIDMVGG